MKELCAVWTKHCGESPQSCRSAPASFTDLVGRMQPLESHSAHAFSEQREERCAAFSIGGAHEAEEVGWHHRTLTVFCCFSRVSARRRRVQCGKDFCELCCTLTVARIRNVHLKQPLAAQPAHTCVLLMHSEPWRRQNASGRVSIQLPVARPGAHICRSAQHCLKKCAKSDSETSASER